MTSKSNSYILVDALRKNFEAALYSGLSPGKLPSLQPNGDISFFGLKAPLGGPGGKGPTVKG